MKTNQRFPYNMRHGNRWDTHGQNRAGHRRRQARRRGDLPAPARAGANLMIHHRASIAEARALQHELNARACGIGGADPGRSSERCKPAGSGENDVKQFGRLDVLVNNASSFFATAIGEITEKDWDDLIGTNLKAPLFLSQAAALELRKRHGCIVNIIDIHAELPMKNYVVYSVAKGGLLALTRSLARELGPEVRVNGVAPGTILWPEDERGSTSCRASASSTRPR